MSANISSTALAFYRTYDVEIKTCLAIPTLTSSLVGLYFTHIIGRESSFAGIIPATAMGIFPIAFTCGCLISEGVHQAINAKYIERSSAQTAANALSLVAMITTAVAVKAFYG